MQIKLLRISILAEGVAESNSRDLPPAAEVQSEAPTAPTWHPKLIPVVEYFRSIEDTIVAIIVYIYVWFDWTGWKEYT